VNAADLPDRSNITDWYIKDFQTEITVNADRSLNIVENILADCGNLPDKHGIFRIIPKSVERAGKVISLPLKISSVTDFSGNKHPYDSSLNFTDNTQILKIGDAEKTVKGENEYRIEYQMGNAVYTLGENEDELYWDVLGGFFDLEIDNFSAKINLPEGVNESNASVSVYSGFVGSRENLLDAQFSFVSDNTIEISASAIGKRQGITVSVKMPKGIFTVEKVSGFNFAFFFIILPVLVFVLCFSVWKKYGKDSGVNKAIMPQYYPPKDMSILEMGAVLKNGKIKKEFLSAEIINLAVKGFLTIEQKKLFWIFGKTYILSATDKKTDSLNDIERRILDALFLGKKSVSLSQIRESFYISYKNISKDVISKIDKDGFLSKKSLTLQTVFYVLGSIFLFSMIFWGSFGFSVNEAYRNLFLVFALSMLPVGPLFLFFGYLMPQRTVKGDEMVAKIKGFKMYMDTAEKHRQIFNEKENIFEKYLPYAVMFGITKQWIKKFKEIYGAKYYDNYAPYWLIGNNLNFSDLSSLNGVISSISSDIGGSLGSSSSSSSGGGSSGGGGGGGGGGGW
jgi:uncharacterized membrane protein YgcG